MKETQKTKKKQNYIKSNKNKSLIKFIDEQKIE